MVTISNGEQIQCPSDPEKICVSVTEELKECEVRNCALCTKDKTICLECDDQSLPQDNRCGGIRIGRHTLTTLSFILGVEWFYLINVAAESTNGGEITYSDCLEPREGNVKPDWFAFNAETLQFGGTAIVLICRSAI